jgi:hypothetical protein
MKVLQKKDEAVIKITSLLETSGQLYDLGSALSSYAGTVASGIINLIGALDIVASNVDQLDPVDRKDIKKRLEEAFKLIGSMGHEFPAIKNLAMMINQF